MDSIWSVCYWRNCPVNFTYRALYNIQHYWLTLAGRKGDCILVYRRREKTRHPSYYTDIKNLYLTKAIFATAYVHVIHFENAK